MNLSDKLIAVLIVIIIIGGIFLMITQGGNKGENPSANVPSPTVTSSHSKAR